jgi:hypothetical protein
MDKGPYIGQLKYPVIIQRETITQGATGAQGVAVVEDLANLKAYIKQHKEADDVEGKLRNLVTKVFITRFRNDFVTNPDNLLLVYAGTTYRVYSVVEIKRRRYIELTCVDYE